MINNNPSLSQNGALPKLLAGPVLRHVCSEHIMLWFVSSIEATYRVSVWAQSQEEEGSFSQCVASAEFESSCEHVVRVGEQAWVYCVTVKATSTLPIGAWLEYELHCVPSSEEANGVSETTGVNGAKPVQLEALMHTELADLSYTNTTRPRFVIHEQVREVLHGSCRKPHYPGEDGLRTIDAMLMGRRSEEPVTPDQQPAMLMMSGDQVYVDDVAGPVLHAIRQVVDLLGLYEEPLEGVNVLRSKDLSNNTQSFYQRAKLLPDIQANETLRQRFFGGAKKPIFTTNNADNHLIAFSEVMALYCLVWSPVLWASVSLTMPERLSDYRERYEQELDSVQQFVAGLAQVRRAMANIPVYMIFDDHDITDDWNLSRDWEESAYQHPFSLRIIGNALMGYTLCQAWGNGAEAVPKALLSQVREVVSDMHNTEAHNTLIHDLLAFEGWSFSLNTQPKVVVLDTRTCRWRSENNASHPSGLMDWEALSDLQQVLIHEPAVILVSPAPIFGVKLIEVIQRVFTSFGHALTVDAENWMAHPGSANVILNIFRHKRTPHTFTILSGDVHYSFVYDVRLRHRESTPHIWQITSSGILNCFPHTLIKRFDQANRWLFSSRSPLNWFTRRRHMRVRPRRPSEYSGRYPHQRLVNGCGIGRVVFDEAGAPTLIEQVFNNNERVQFLQGYDSDWVD